MNIRWSLFFESGLGEKRERCRKWLKGGIYRGNPIVSTPLSNPTHISTENSAPGEKQEKQNNSKASERKKYVKIVRLDQTDYRNNDKGTAQALN